MTDLDENVSLLNGRNTDKTEHIRRGDGSENQPGVTRVYRRRWWVMLVFVIFASNQSVVWNTWSPIAAASESVFRWTDSTVAAIINTSEISYLVLVIPVNMLTNVKGVRFATIMCTGLMFIASFSRCFSTEKNVISVMAYVCALLQGAGATLPFAAPALISAVWFPPQERQMATAIISFSTYIGFSLSFVLGPLFVSDPIYKQIDNVTCEYSDLNISCWELNNTSQNNTLTSQRLLINGDAITQGISYLMYLHAAWAGTAFLLTLVSLPDKPPLPPSITASLKRTDYKATIPAFLRNGSLWLVMLSGGLLIGVTGVWIAMLDILLKPLGVSQVDAGLIGFWHAVSGCTASLVVAKFSDLFHRRRKLFLIILFVSSLICSIWFLLLCVRVISHDLKQLYAAGILLGIFVIGTTPLFYEMCAEAAYPVAEGVTGAMYTVVMGIFGIIFVTIASVPGLGTTWMYWALPVTVLVGLPLLAVFPESYKRTDIDYQITRLE